MTEYLGAKIGVLNSGSFRSDSVEPKGPVTIQTINTILPFHDQAVLAKYSGEMLLKVLENSVSEYPTLSGRFLQVSGIHFEFDPAKPPGQRIDPTSVFCRNDSGEMKQLDNSQTYVMALKTFIFIGKEGFPASDESSVLQRSCTRISDMISEFLMARCSTAVNGVIPKIHPKVENRIKCLTPSKDLLEAYEQD